VKRSLTHEGTEWASNPHQNLVSDYTTSDNFAMVRLESTDGHEWNLYSSTRDLATWGYVHLKNGVIDGTQLIIEEVFELTEKLKAQFQTKRILGWYHQADWYYALAQQDAIA